MRWVFLLLVSVAVPLSAVAEGLSFEHAGEYGTAATFQVALGDLDGDGDLDAFFANMDWASEIWMNNGDGQFARSRQLFGSGAHGIGIGDLDGDGDADLLIGRADRGSASDVYFNNGQGGFLPASWDLGDREIAANAVTLFDAEGDGDLDAGIYYASRFSVLYTNDGTGRFEPLGARISGMAFWGDLDGDGDVDVLTQLHSGGFEVLRNEGANDLVSASHISAPVPFVPGSAALADVDTDGDLDLIATGAGDFDAPLTVLRNDGAGGFSYAASTSFRAAYGRISLGGVDGDGDPDVFTGNLGQSVHMGLNDGSGEFVDAGLNFDLGDNAGISALGDLDGDGDLDLFTARYGSGGPNGVWLNRSNGDSID